MSRFVTFTALAVVLAVPAVAEDVRPASTISSVTVYPAGAAIVRSVPIDLPAGASVIVLDNLPVETETDSITVEGKADAALEIGSVATRILPADPEADPERKSILDAVRRLEDQRREIADKIGALDGRQRFIEKMLENVPGGFSRALGQGGSGIGQWSVASTTLGNELDAIATAKRKLETEDRTLVERIEDRNEALGELPPPRDRLEVRVEVAAGQAVNGTLEVGYRAPSAWWAPSYHAQLSTADAGGKPSLAIIRRAEVTQSTGEDWAGVALTLSTARPAGGTAAPYLEASLAMFSYGYEEGRGDYSYDKMMAPPPVPSARAIGEPEAPAMAQEMPVVPIEAAADFGDFRAEYDVPGTVSLKSGVGSRAFRMATDKGDVELEVRAVPILSSEAYLTARFMAPASAPFLAGKIALFRDGAYVGQGAMPFVAGGTKVDLGFGVDDRVKVTRIAIDREVGETGILTSRRTDTRRFRMTVENLHQQPIRITLLDRMPYSEDENIVVARLDDMTAPTTENVDDRRGVMAWSFVYDAGESRDVQNAYTVTWPAGETVVLAD